jgi:ornithine carbamoyltransferase
VPVINGLTDKSHPCQIMADVMTFEERMGPIKGRTIAWVGDGNNVAVSWMHAAARFGFALRVACPEELRPSEDVIDWVRREKGDVTIMEDPAKAVRGADCIVTDTWVSMGQTDGARRKQLLKPYAVDAALMAKAAKGAIFMHCLPAYRGHEVSEAVLEGPQSVVFEEAENRLHAQKAILAWCLGAF